MKSAQKRKKEVNALFWPGGVFRDSMCRKSLSERGRSCVMSRVNLERLERECITRQAVI